MNFRLRRSTVFALATVTTLLAGCTRLTESSTTTEVSDTTAATVEGYITTTPTTDQAVAGKSMTTTTLKESTTTTVRSTPTSVAPAKTQAAPGCASTYVFPDLSSAPGAGGSYPKPSVTASCGNGLLTVKSNGMIGYTFVSKTPNGLRAQSYTWSVTTSPKIAASTTSISSQLGAVGFTVSGIPIYGPMEGPVPPQEAFGDPVYNNLLDSCKGHTGYNADYHYHAIVAESACYLNETIVGYALDGFPVYSNPGYKYKSGYATTGNPRSNAWSAYTYSSGDANTLDACNGRTDADGNYRYYATEAFPYIIGCYAGTPRTQVGAAGAPMPPMNNAAQTSISKLSSPLKDTWLCVLTNI